MPSPDWYHPIDYTDFRALRNVSLEARWVFMETFCGELGHKTGLALCRPVLIASECGIPVKRVEECLAELERAGIVLWSRDARIAYHVGSLERQGPKPTTKHYKGWAKDLAAFDDCEAKSRAIAELEGNAEPIESLSEGYPNPIDSVSLQEQEQEQEQEQNRNGSLALTVTEKKGRKKPEPKPKEPFVKPTVDEVRAVFREHGLPQHAAFGKGLAFWNWCEEREWKRGKSHMTRWRQAVGKWAGDWFTQNPQFQHREPPQHTPTINGEIDAWGKR